MSSSIFHKQYEFIKAGDVAVGTPEAEAAADLLIDEEYEEHNREPYFLTHFKPNSIKEACDLLYVLINYLNVVLGPDLAAKCLDDLHENNMSKCIDGKIVKSPEGKVLKPEGYQKLDLTPLLAPFIEEKQNEG